MGPFCAVPDPVPSVPSLLSCCRYCSNYVMYRALVMSAFRLLYPHQAIMPAILKWLRILSRQSPPDTALATSFSACLVGQGPLAPAGLLELTVAMPAVPCYPLSCRGQDPTGQTDGGAATQLPLRPRHWHPGEAPPARVGCQAAAGPGEHARGGPARPPCGVYRATTVGGAPTLCVCVCVCVCVSHLACRSS